jgi:3-oxoacyl-[acyl-carrier-protein] synthase-3
MQGRDTYKQAVRSMVNVCSAILNRNNLGIDDVDLFVPHQANMRIIEAVGARLEIAGDRVFTNVSEYGNTSAASIPLALTEARAQGRVKNGSRVLVTAFGSGLTWGAALLDF